MSPPSATIERAEESVSDGCVARPDLTRSAVALFLYTIALLLVPAALWPFLPQMGRVMAAVLGAVFLLCLPITTLHFWWNYRFRVDAEGIHQRLVLFDITIDWNDSLFFFPITPWICRTAVVRGSGGLLSRMRGQVKHGFVSVQVRLPHRGLISNVSELQDAVDRFAPPGHPLRRIYAVESGMEE